MYFKHGCLILSFTISCMLAVVLATGYGIAAYASSSKLAFVSGSSPYAGCPTTGQPGKNYVHAETESYVSVNPTNKANIIGAWQQDRWSNGGSNGLVAASSFDGGKNWSETPLPFTRCAPGGLPYHRASDPWVSFGPDGIAYTIAITFDSSGGRNAVAAATSRDGGKTWGNLNVLVSYTTKRYSTDKEAVTADPLHPGVAYAVWDTRVAPTDKPHASARTGNAYFSRTMDGGKTWSTPAIIVSTPPNKTIGNQIVVDPHTGTLYNFFNLIQPPNNAKKKQDNVAFVKSTDGGQRWSQPQIIDVMHDVGVKDPNTGAKVRTGSDIPEPAIDAQTGQLYVVWQDARFNGGAYDEVALSTSTDGGASWSTPMRVNTPTGRAAFTPTVAVNATGKVGVTYYDLRNLQTGNTSTLPTDYWIKTSPAGAKNFGNDTHISDSFDMLTAPYAKGYFVGDYEGLTSSGNAFLPFFVQVNSGNADNRTDVFFTQF